MKPAKPKMIRFTVGGQPFCIALDAIRRITRIAELERNKTGNEPYGWVNLGNQRIAVIDGARKLEMPAARQGLGSQILVLDLDPAPIGLLIDHIDRIFELGPGMLNQLPAALRPAVKNFFSGLVYHDAEVLPQLAPAQLATRGHFESITPQSPYKPLTAGAAGKPVSDSRRQGAALISFAVDNSGDSSVSVCFSITQIAEILESAQQIPMPTGRAHLLGLADWRGRPVPILDLTLRLGLGPTRLATAQRLLIARTRTPGEFAGFAIPSSLHMHKLPSKFQPCRREVRVNPFAVMGIFENGDEIFILPDLDKILFDN